MTENENKLWIEVYSRTISEVLRRGIRYDSKYAATEAKEAAELAIMNFRHATRSPDLQPPVTSGGDTASNK